MASHSSDDDIRLASSSKLPHLHEQSKNPVVLLTLLLLLMWLSNKVKVELEISQVFDARMDHKKARLQTVLFCLLVVELEFWVGLHLIQKVQSCPLLVVEMSCFSEQKELRIQNVTREMTTTELPGDYSLLGPFPHLGGWQT